MNKRRGFTIVELLIVIVVIGILAAITIVAYNGIQVRAKNTKTINATATWIKALKLYNAEKDDWPTVSSCLGTMTTYQGGSGRCFTSNAFSVNQTFLDQMQPYITTFLEPDTTDVSNGITNTPRRGILYHISGSDRLIWMMLSGVSNCPDMGIPTNPATGTEPGGMHCVYKIN